MEFIDAYKRKFVRAIEMQNSALMFLTKQVANININYPKAKYNSFDGFSLDYLKILRYNAQS